MSNLNWKERIMDNDQKFGESNFWIGRKGLTYTVEGQNPLQELKKQQCNKTFFLVVSKVFVLKIGKKCILILFFNFQDYTPLGHLIVLLVFIVALCVIFCLMWYFVSIFIFIYE